MSKQELIDTIRQHNPSADPAFLTAFDVAALDRYLDHLRHSLLPRGASSMWIRAAETHAITTGHR